MKLSTARKALKKAVNKAAKSHHDALVSFDENQVDSHKRAVAKRDVYLKRINKLVEAFPNTTRT